MSSQEDDSLRARIAQMLAAGLVTQLEPFPENDREFSRLLDGLAELPKDDLKAKLTLSRFTDKPCRTDQMRCQERMYYLVHRK